MPAHEIAGRLGATAEAVDTVPLLVELYDRLRVDAPAVSGLAAVVAGDVDAGAWASTVTAPPRRTSKRFARAA